jgi:segregation and condensation protein B
MSGFKRNIDWESLDYDDTPAQAGASASDASAHVNAQSETPLKTGATSPAKGRARGGHGAMDGEGALESSVAFKVPAGQTLKGRIEAVLFMTGKALSPADIAEIVEAPTEEVELALVELMGDYGFREESALEIDDTDGYILQVKEEYGDVVNKMMPLEMSAAELRTLSAIAIKAPVLQTDLIEWRGASAYEHIASLLKRKLISKRREGRTYILNITRNFHEYFKLTADKKDLAELVQLIGKEAGEKSQGKDEKTLEELPDVDPAP